MKAMERAVMRELRLLGQSRAAHRSALAELALFLARTIDDRDGQAPTTTVRLASELRVTLGQLREVARDADGGGGSAGQLPAPSWDAEDAGPADAGVAGGGGGAAAG